MSDLNRTRFKTQSTTEHFGEKEIQKKKEAATDNGCYPIDIAIYLLTQTSTVVIFTLNVVCILLDTFLKQSIINLKNKPQKTNITRGQPPWFLCPQLTPLKHPLQEKFRKNNLSHGVIISRLSQCEASCGITYHSLETPCQQLFALPPGCGQNGP